MKPMEANKPLTLILRTAGTNCDMELAHAFQLAGSDTEAVHLNRLVEQPELLRRFDLLGIPGGFSYGDDIAAGRIWANRLRHRLYPELRRFVADGKPIIGICNGFQVLVKLGLLPDFDPERDEQPPKQVATLTDNTVPRFMDRWVGLDAETDSRCIWTQGLASMSMCIAHGEGRFVAPDAVLDELEANGQVALRYSPNPNGSKRDIAGVCDRTGRVFGLMPHPERFTDPTHLPDWTRPGKVSDGTPPGLRMFLNAVEYVKSQQAAKAG